MLWSIVQVRVLKLFHREQALVRGVENREEP